MANRNLQVQQPATIFTLRNLILAAGVAVVAPYIIRRVLPLINRGLGNITGNDMALAGKDGIRDAADKFNVGGVGGTLKRAAGRVSDHLRSDM